MQRKRGRRDEPNLVVLKYTPQWSVFSSDSFDARAYTEAKEVGPDLCKAFIMRADRKVYARASAVSVGTKNVRPPLSSKCF